ncbi:35036_t:CDS:2 [Gigaspora margarita]|uniref:35036_t:CDS:1 n=1 Tax=Gigaspora margarita TaxID=4874 RepID=A0ABN7V037_GIGMA|nr:35036_t:CDS:2 [Gigaspora margarita]
MFYTTQGTSSQDLDSTINPSSSISERDEVNIIENLDTSGQDELSKPLRNYSSSQDNLYDMNNLDLPSSYSDLIYLESLNQDDTNLQNGHNNDNDSNQVQCYHRKRNYNRNYTGPRRIEINEWN